MVDTWDDKTLPGTTSHRTTIQVRTTEISVWLRFFADEIDADRAEKLCVTPDNGSSYVVCVEQTKDGTERLGEKPGSVRVQEIATGRMIPRTEWDKPIRSDDARDREVTAVTSIPRRGGGE